MSAKDTTNKAMRIQDLTPAKIVQAGVFPAIENGLIAARLADFLAEVDWSYPDDASPNVVTLLGRLEAWSSEFAEGELTAESYLERLTQLVSASGLAVAS